jgi:nucleotide-binding universal stress UspA family protein
VTPPQPSIRRPTQGHPRLSHSFSGVIASQAGYVSGMDRIIVGYDGSEQAERALGRAAELAQAFGARLVVVSVARPPGLTAPLVADGPVEVPIPAPTPGPIGTGVPLPVPAEPQPEPEELAQHDLERARMSLASRGVDAEYVAEVGDATERLLALAAEREADLLVVGSREHGFLEHLLGRPVDEAVAKHAGCDVLLVH